MKAIIDKRFIRSWSRPATAGLVVGLTLFVSAAGAHIAAPKHRGPIRIGMIPLLASPQSFNGKVIRTIGFLHIGSHPEDDSLWLHEEDARIPLDENAFGLRFSEEQRNRFKPLSLTYVMIEGTVRAHAPVSESASEGVSLSLFSGRIVDIQDVSGWLPYTPVVPETK